MFCPSAEMNADFIGERIDPQRIFEFGGFSNKNSKPLKSKTYGVTRLPLPVQV